MCFWQLSKLHNTLRTFLSLLIPKTHPVTVMKHICIGRPGKNKNLINSSQWWALKCNYMQIIKNQMVLTILRDSHECKRKWRASRITGSQWCVYELSKCSFAEIGLLSVHHHQSKRAKILLKSSSTVTAQSLHLTCMSKRIWPDEAVSSTFGTLWKVTGSRSI